MEKGKLDAYLLATYLEEYKNSTCTKCDKKAIYVITYCDPVVILCEDHAPRMSSGAPGFNELTIIYKNGSSNLKCEPQYLRESDLVNCWHCKIKIEDYSLFTHVSYKGHSREDDFKWDRIIPAIPVKDLEYYICKDRESCDLRADPDDPLFNRET